MSTDFFDEDLVDNGVPQAPGAPQPAPPNPPQPAPVQNPVQPAPVPVTPAVPQIAPLPVPTPTGPPASAAALTASVPSGRMVQQKEDLSGQMVDHAREMEALRLRQEELEREQRDLQDRTRMQDEYSHAKRSIVGDLARSMSVVEKDEIQARETTDLLSATKDRFKQMLADLMRINEDGWPPDAFHHELDEAMGTVEGARTDYEKAMVKMKALGAGSGKAAEAHLSARSLADMGFGSWLKVGAAVTLPLVLVLLICFAVWLTMNW